MQELQLSLSPKEAADDATLKSIIAKKLSVNSSEISHIHTIKKSIDSRGAFPIVLLRLQIYINESFDYQYQNEIKYKNVANSNDNVIVVGAGPAGLFAALRLLELGIKPIVLERGKDVSDRKIDIAQLNRNVSLNIESNYCFGEGGAGTFSDGKLFTRSKKRGNSQRIFEIFHYHGAQDEILYEAHPHIGTDILPKVIKNMRQQIIDCGGEIYFSTCVDSFVVEDDNIKGVKCRDGKLFESDNVILASGHSARDIYRQLHSQGIAIEAKGFAMGVRVEHPQTLIDSIQYHCRERNEFLPAASYSLVSQVDGRGVYSFCMCPGGHIVPSATENNQIVVNGMSASRRNSPFANSGIVVEIQPEDLKEYEQYGELRGLEFQSDLERMTYNNNGGLGQVAPAQRLGDFVKGRLSMDLPESSYLPGLISSPLHFWLPEHIGKRLREGFKAFDRKMKGFVTNDAIVVGVESRSSSPVRIPRNSETMEHVTVHGLYPAGEGSGYSGGITSSAIDGENCANKIAEKLSANN
ncbi:MAG: NAD(P)/FAD-dependent oxidoreductase [bacterium]